MPASQHQTPKSDIEISQSAKIVPINKIARERLGIEPENLDPYGHYKAKLSMDFVKSLKNRPNGKLILVSAITPTPAGEGKTTTTVGLTDALNHIGKKAMLCLREPSIVSSLGGAANGFPREDGFDITVASEVMAIFCLARDLDDLKQRLSKIVIAYTRDRKPVRASDLK